MTDRASEIIDAGDAEAAKEHLANATEISGEDSQKLQALINKAAEQAEAAGEDVDGDGVVTGLESLTKDQLTERAEAAGVTVTSSMTKADLIKAIEEAEST